MPITKEEMILIKNLFT